MPRFRFFTRILPAVFLGSALWLTVSAAPVFPGAWHSDHAQASAIAREAGKQSLVLFTGIAWEPWSQRLQAEVVATPQFTEGLAADFVITHVDLPEIPRPEEELSETERRHYALARDLRLTVLPSFFLCAADGRPYDLVGYREGDPQALLAEIRSKRAKHAALVEKIPTLEGPARAREIDAWLETLPEPLRPLQAEKIQAIIDADPDDSTGLRSKYRVFLMLPEARRHRFEGGLDEAERLYLQVLRETRTGGGEARQDLYYELADVYFQRKDYDALLDTLDRAISSAPEGPRMPVIREMMDVFTRSWIWTRYDREAMKAADYDHKRMVLAPDAAPRFAMLIEQARTVAPQSARNQVLDRMAEELAQSPPASDAGSRPEAPAR
jgi:tetratricopeptide (TPR) repeat protein